MQMAVIAHNIRSAHNIGSIFRTCEGFGVDRLYISGYSPYPRLDDDQRPPYIIERLNKKISKTALGAEQLVPFEHAADTSKLISQLKQSGFTIVGLEQAITAVSLQTFTTPEKCVLVLGEEVGGIPETLQKLCDTFVEIPMYGQKQSFNVSVAAGIALYQLSVE